MLAITRGADQKLLSCSLGLCELLLADTGVSSKQLALWGHGGEEVCGPPLTNRDSNKPSMQSPPCTTSIMRAA
ncbi:hypothetical protein CEXT_671341 [Caerostris extrusa]|uniref:Uncharacterized protein n=1 Tax=Caerostris extrusa TaxID=172846 RepID=A0AAV4VM63_CAEEX|nr:hypothetical protein CEXT_671341 [Caerostris extrusa]